MKELSKDRLDTLETIQKHTNYDDYNIYSMEIKYDYNIDNVTPIIEGTPNDKELLELTMEDAMPGIRLDVEPPNYGCSAFTIKNDDKFLFGRNYDFRYDSSTMLVRCNPKDGYKSIAFCALDNFKANEPEKSDEEKVACLLSPYMCIDGMNEKGLGIAILTLGSSPTLQRTGKPVLLTTVLVRLVLDKAATTEEAIELIKKYDNYASSGRDYHFYITDASGDGRVVEFDPEKEERPMVVTKVEAVTNFHAMYTDKVKPNQTNGIYGKGKERYLKIMEVINNNGNGIGDAWKALKAASQEPKPNDITSNTQWSILFNLDKLDCEIILRRHWEDIYKFKI